MHRRGSFRPYLPGLLIALSGLALSVGGFYGSKRAENVSARSEFALASEARLSALRREMEANLAAMGSVRGFAEVSGDFTPEAFRTFVEHALEGYPSIRAMEWLPRVTREQRAAFERSTGHPIRQGVAPNTLHPAEDADEYFPVKYLYPLTKQNDIALGYDVGASRALRGDIQRSRSTGKPTVGSRLRLVESADGFGIPVLLPVYKGGNDAKPDSLSGFVFGVMQLSDVVETALRYVEPRGIHISLLDESAVPGSRLIYFHPSRLGTPAKLPVNETQVLNSSEIRYMSQVTLGGRTWLFVCTPSEQFFSQSPNWKTYGILVGGLFVTCALTAYFLLSMVHTFRVEALVDELKNTNEKLNLEIAERRTMERNLALARDQALESSRLKSQFLANMSHEIRTPMNGVIGMTDLLLDTPLDSDQKEMAHAVQSSAETLLKIIDDILDLSRIEAGKMSIDRVQFYPRQMLDDVMRLLSVRAKSKGLHIGCMIESDVPETVVGDPVRIAQVLTNLVGNAVKFTEKGLITLALRSQTDAAGLLLRFEVKDTGIGIDEKQKARLFQPFSQGDGSMKRRFGSTGLGLAISKELVDRMGGEICVFSTPDLGSTFWFTVRVERAISTADTVRA